MLVFLIGMPSSGKSTISQLLGGCDTDDIIDLHQLAADSITPDEFYDREMKRILAWLTPDLQDIVATGGSIVHRQATMDAIRQIGTVVWLYAPLPTLEQRLGDWTTRGIIMPEGIHTLRELFAFREPLYSMNSDIMMNTSIMTVEECAAEIKKLCC